MAPNESSYKTTLTTFRNSHLSKTPSNETSHIKNISSSSDLSSSSSSSKDLEIMDQGSPRSSKISSQSDHCDRNVGDNDLADRQTSSNSHALRLGFIVHTAVFLVTNYLRHFAHNIITSFEDKNSDIHPHKTRKCSAKIYKGLGKFFILPLLLSCVVGATDAQGRRTGRQNVLTTVEGGGWLMRNVLNMPSECDMDGSLAPCTFILTCLIQGGFPVNKCGGGYIYTCCVPPGGARGARGAPVASVRSDFRSGLSLRNIGGFMRDDPSFMRDNPSFMRDTPPFSPESRQYSNSGPPNYFPRHPRFRQPYSSFRHPWRAKDLRSSNHKSPAPTSYYHQGDEDQSRFQNENSLSYSPLNIVSNSVDERNIRDIEGGHDSQHLISKPKKTSHKENEIYYNEAECGIQRLPTNVLMSRIIGGDEAQFAELPWQAHIRIAGYQCGGVLVNRYYVATAAHCVHKARLKDITIHLGEFDTKDTGRHYEPFPKESFGVVEKRTHPNFKYMQTQPDRFDVAVLRLSRPANYRPNIVPICLPYPGNHFPGARGVVAGWGKIDNSFGKTGTNILRKVEVPIIDNKECLRWHHHKKIDVKLHYEMFCAGHSQGKMDACLGDSGGPLVVKHKGRWTLAGITSAGFGCAVDHQPGIYHKIAITSGWIAANVKP